MCVCRENMKKRDVQSYGMAERRVLCARVYYNKKIMFFPRGNTEKAKVSREETWDRGNNRVHNF